MHVSARMPLALCAALFIALLATTGAQATPITVSLRVEGSSKTLFEGPISTEGATFETHSSVGPHPCDYAENGASGGEFANGGNASGTPTTALRDAALASGLEFDAKWFGSGVGGNENPGDFFVTQVGSDVELTEAPFASWGYAVNDTTAPVGGCQIALAPGNEVLWAYNYFNLSHLLSISGPSSANAGAPTTVHVVDGQTGAPIAGAAIGEDVAGVTTTIPGSPLTNAEGNATITLAHAGTVKLKSTQAESVRSNGLAVCVHNGADGTCGTTIPGVLKIGPFIKQPVPLDIATAGGVINGRRYSRRHAPRILRGLVHVSANGTLREVRISLQRRKGRRCLTFSGASETFMHARCGVKRFFSVGSSESFSYLLPAPLPAGHYVYDIEAIDSAGHPTKLIAGVSHISFYVK
ncbi:MAG: Ig-like domain-containing protein [Solirubrobacteraceae bacterium]